MEKAPCAIVNPCAGSVQSFEEVRDALEARGFEVRRTLEPGDAAALARERALAGSPLVVAVGGDGTVSETANGLLSVRTEARFGIVPLGTGNDLARALSIPLEVPGALEVLARGRERAMDVIAVEPDDAPRTFAVNVAAGGFSGLVDEVLTHERKARWGPLAYLWSAIEVIPDVPRWRTMLAWDDGDAEEVEALNVVVANGSSCGGGWKVAPNASVEDGWLDVVVVQRSSALDLARIAVRLASGDVDRDDEVLRRRARSVRITSEPPMWFNVDGELVSKAAVTFRVVPRALRVLVGSS